MNQNGKELQPPGMKVPSPGCTCSACTLARTTQALEPAFKTAPAPAGPALTAATPERQREDALKALNLALAKWATARAFPGKPAMANDTPAARTKRLQNAEPAKAWIIVRLSKGASQPRVNTVLIDHRPTILHTDLAEADREVDRLATENPGEVFMVFAALAAVRLPLGTMEMMKL